MGSATGPKRYSSSYSSRKWYSYIEWSISYPDDLTAKITAKLYFRGNDSTWGQVGKYCSGSITIDGHTSSFSAGSQSWQFSGMTSKKVLEYTAYVSRYTYARNISISGKVNLSSSSAYHSSSGASTASGTETIAAMPSYAVNYYGNGATGGSTAAQTKFYNTPLTLRSNGFTRSGYSFWHWNTGSSNNGTTYNAGASYGGNAALNLYAIWNPIIYYNANGGEGEPASQTKTFNTNLTLSSTVPTRIGYDFVKWNTAADGTGTDYSPGATYTSNSTATLYAIWKRKPVYVKVNGEWKTGVPYVKVNGVWYENAGVLVKIGGTWIPL